jgi:hypothetical protein
MYKEAKNVELPDKKQAIWRYMDFTSFVSIIDSSKLHFTRVDQLPDPFEGSFPMGNVERRREDNAQSQYYKKHVKYTFVSCWHINNYQSAAMWKLYLQSNEGIAIRSSVGRLIDSLVDKKYDIYVGKIEYISYSKDLIREGSLSPYFHKRKSFEHEKELRAIIQSYPRYKNGEINWSISPNNKSGLNVEIDVNVLVEKIVLSPLCPLWQKELVKSVLKKFEYDMKVTRSTLYTRDERIVY